MVLFSLIELSINIAEHERKFYTQKSLLRDIQHRAALYLQTTEN